jgi:hypothetical protein
VDSKAARAVEAHESSLAHLSLYRQDLQLRDSLIRQLHRDGWSYARLGNLFHLSRENMAKIVRRDRPVGLVAVDSVRADGPGHLPLPAELGSEDERFILLHKEY